jgi:hypothetical protein
MEITEPPEDRASRYRFTAVHLRQQAEALDKTQERAELLAIADQYDRLAERLAGSRADKTGATRQAPRVRVRQNRQDDLPLDLGLPCVDKSRPDLLSQP